MTAPDWTEFTHATAVPDASGASGRYGTGNPLEKIANTGPLGIVGGGIRRKSVLGRRSPPRPDGDPPAQLSARERQTLGEWVTHVERFEFPEISIIRVERPDTVLEKDRRDVSVRDEVSTHRHVAGDVLICV